MDKQYSAITELLKQDKNIALNLWWVDMSSEHTNQRKVGIIGPNIHEGKR